MNIITSALSFKNHARLMPDILNILHKHAKIFQASLQDSCTISGKNLVKSCKKTLQDSYATYFVNSCLNTLDAAFLF